LAIDSISLQALQIFKNEAHPSASGIGKSKEGRRLPSHPQDLSCTPGFSLYGLMNQTKTPMGKNLLKKWFFHPRLDLRLLEDRLDTISYFLDPELDIHRYATQVTTITFEIMMKNQTGPL